MGVVFFESCRVLCELSYECLTLLNGWMVRENFCWEGIMVVSRVSFDVVKVFPPN